MVMDTLLRSAIRMICVKGVMKRVTQRLAVPRFRSPVLTVGELGEETISMRSGV